MWKARWALPRGPLGGTRQYGHSFPTGRRRNPLRRPVSPTALPEVERTLCFLFFLPPWGQKMRTLDLTPTVLWGPLELTHKDRHTDQQN